jgi:hypothetical protein
MNMNASLETHAQLAEGGQPSQQAIPLPKPSSCGNSSQGMHVRFTNRMPLSTIS